MDSRSAGSSVPILSPFPSLMCIVVEGFPVGRKRAEKFSAERVPNPETQGSGRDESDAPEFLSRFEADGLSRRDAHFFSGARVAADARLAGFDAEDAELAQLDALTRREPLLQHFEDSLDGLFGLRAADARAADDQIHKVELDHPRLPRLSQHYAREPLAGCQGNRGLPGAASRPAVTPANRAGSVPRPLHPRRRSLFHWRGAPDLLRRAS